MASDQTATTSAAAPPSAAAPAAEPAKLPDAQPSEASNELPEVLTTPTGDMWPRPYFFEDGLRRVAPYHFTYHTWAKQRWRGRKLIDIFEDEFRDRTLEYYRYAMETGAIVVNGKAVGPDHLVKNGDLVNHTIHRHEPPVTGEPIRVIHEDDEMIVVNKPSGVPVHPAGRYKYNTLIEIMKSERGEHFLPYPCHRLDRLTSGILFVAKTPQAAVKLTAQIRAHTVRKEYLARVAGKFPDGEIVCDQPILQISPRLGLNRVRANGKSARTVFKRLAYYPPDTLNDSEAAEPKSAERLADEERRPWIKKEGYSIVRCLPLTGRTHQIRVHLQFVGHPIENDPLYANQRVWGINLGCNDSDAVENTDEDIMSRLERMGKQDIADAVAYHDELVDLYQKRRAEKLSGELCDVCDTPLYTDPGEHELSLWLHSLRYEDAGGAWSYTSPMPAWALPPDGINGPTEVGGLEELVGAVPDADPAAEADPESAA
ncbi:RluA family pseudouridine synthase [Colletotrichum simmondsii]|uniref:Pseudouridine synthase n=1 Tax=Colletotrichum simmondsii TaxID=703756 RepID=A0A135RTE1_9PEZI|nr:RluA family pseudouridine synthase [Colletotrichum simmondsii]